MGSSSNPHPGLRAHLWHVYPWVTRRCLLTYWDEKNITSRACPFGLL